MNTINIKFAEDMLNNFAGRLGIIEKIVKHLERNAMIEFQKKPVIGVISPRIGEFQDVKIQRSYTVRKMTNCFNIEESVIYRDNYNTVVFACKETNNYEDPNEFIRTMIDLLANVESESIEIIGTYSAIEAKCVAVSK